MTNILTDSGGRQKRRFAATRSRFFAKMRPPRVFWANFGSRKRYARTYARDLKMAFGPPTRLHVVHVGFTVTGDAKVVSVSDEMIRLLARESMTNMHGS